MAVSTLNFTTGPSVLPDVGVLSYNGCVFSPLFETQVSGRCIPDAANRTVKLMEYSITVDGYVTISTGDVDIDAKMQRLQLLLTAQGGALQYEGRGFDIVVNVPGADINSRDAVWGPVPELLDFTPLGGGNSAKVRWQVKVRVSALTTNKSGRPSPPGSKNGIADIPLLQFCYETGVSYDEAGFSKLSIRGVLEIPLTRTPNQLTRTLNQTADDMRSDIDRRIINSVDLSRFRPTQREFNLSKDKRLLDWSFAFEEKPYMDLPPGCTVAQGTYTVRPVKAGMGLSNWFCTLRATYTVRADKPRRIAWLAFLAMLRERIAESAKGIDPTVDGPQNPPRQGLLAELNAASPNPTRDPMSALIQIMQSQAKKVEKSNKGMLLDFSVDEGLYLDSKTVSFSATWRTVTTFSHILLASGIWKKLPENDVTGKSLWATTMSDISGSRSWLTNQVDPALDVIVDFGS